MKKRSLIFILLSLFTICLFAQEKDRRAELDYTGRITEISIAPDERIFITTYVGEMFYADNIYSPFKELKRFYYKKDNKFEFEFEKDFNYPT